MNREQAQPKRTGVALAMELIDRYYPEGSPARDILIAHSRDVATMALEIIAQHPELGADATFVEEAAWLHDLGVFMTDAPGIGCHGDEPYIRHGYMGAELLRAHGLLRHAHVAERHTGSGLEMAEIRARGIDLPEGIYMPQSVEERIVCYADKFYSKSHPGQRKPLDRVRASMLRHGAAALARFERLHSELGLVAE